MPGSLLIVTGLPTGEVPITVEVPEDEPPVHLRGEEIVEVSFTPGDEGLLLTGCTGSSEPPGPDPARAVSVAVQHAGPTHGRDRLDVLHRAIRELPPEC